MDRNEQIRQRAHQIWEAAGCPDGQDAEHWRQAEQQLSQEGETQGTDMQEDLADVMASPQGDIPDPGQADGHIITEEEGGLSDMPDEAQQAVDDPMSQSSKPGRKSRMEKP
ncbi:DUF2934 domain-containing protein [Paracoccus sp. SM22M-07]|uniref:DUF2934 domain-containing protein n=1 Tax=Paracoccus sp. SM22M-07 TaxID=1520813 RepID=UPI000931636A|nr:DUF2934 domain-containing protein [Paracoccus sp. SM22M-07]